MVKKNIITLNKFKEALVGTGGIISAVARKLGVHRITVVRFVEKNPEVRELIKEEEETILDMAEGSLYSQVKGKEQWATKYLLSTKGKHRGYVERTENITTDTTSKEELKGKIKKIQNMSNKQKEELKDLLCQAG